MKSFWIEGAHIYQDSLLKLETEIVEQSSSLAVAAARIYEFSDDLEQFVSGDKI